MEYANKLVQEYQDVIKGESPADKTAASAPFQGFGTFAPAGQSSLPKPGGTPLFNFSSAPVPANSQFGFGGFGAPKPAVAAEDNGDEDDGEGEDEQPSLALESTSADILMSKRVGLMSLNRDTKKWKDRGTGTVSLRRNKNGSGSPYIVFTTDSGRVLLNAPLLPGLKPTVNPKQPQNVIMMLISRVSSDEPEERGTHLFKCNSLDQQKEFVAKINELLN